MSEDGGDRCFNNMNTNILRMSKLLSTHCNDADMASNVG